MMIRTGQRRVGGSMQPYTQYRIYRRVKEVRRLVYDCLPYAMTLALLMVLASNF
jgi:hypothetical protein